jgi:hypothetical protein
MNPSDTLPPPSRRSIPRRASISPGDVTRWIAVAALAVALAGCIPYHSTAFYPDASIGKRGISPVQPGAQLVFEVCRQWSAPIPDVATGYCFELAVDTALVRAGSTIPIPGPGATPSLWKLAGAPRSNTSSAARGTLRVVRVSPDRIVAALDVRDDSIPGGWSIHGTRAFRRRVVMR